MNHEPHEPEITTVHNDGTITCEGEPFDLVGFALDWEAGLLDDEPEAIIRGFQELINSGIVWKLQGMYGRTAQALIDAGYCHPLDA